MRIVALYSLILLLGMIVSQCFDLNAIEDQVHLLSVVCLGYIMIEVGLEFTLAKDRLKSYLSDFLIAAGAAILPWLFCSLWMVIALNMYWKEGFVLGLFAAPTSAGILFAMLAAAGLGASWLFRKAQVLAIFDDLATILLMIPLKILIVGADWKLFHVFIILSFLLYLAYRYLHKLKLPTGKFFLFLYGVGIVFITELFEWAANIEIEVLLPAFIWGSILLCPKSCPQDNHSHRRLLARISWGKWFDLLIKCLFMFLVGASLPKVAFHEIDIGWTLLHIVIITLLSNLGKGFIFFFYKKEASFQERIAASIAMFPRGEVGAGILILAMGYGFAQYPIMITSLALAVNLLMTGFFISIVMWLVKKPASLDTQ